MENVKNYEGSMKNAEFATLNSAFTLVLVLAERSICYLNFSYNLSLLPSWPV
jgi:hypothetical protein